MPTRLYFSNAEIPAVTPAFAGWGETAQAVRRKLLSAKSAGESLVEGSLIALSGVVASVDRQFVGDPLAAQTISGTVKCQLAMLDDSETGLATSRLAIRVYSGDGATLRGTLLSVGQYGPATAYDSSRRNKTFADGDALSGLAVQAGDRLIVEIGHVLTSSSAANVSAFFGAPSGSDLPENETDTNGITLAPWIEFSGNLAFQSGAVSLAPNLLLLGVG